MATPSEILSTRTRIELLEEELAAERARLREQAPFRVEGEEDPLAKRFRIRGPLDLLVDADDCDGVAARMLARAVVDLLNEHWVGVGASRCVNEDCELHWQTRADRATTCPDCGEATDRFEAEA